jgi:hypothetical protein
MFIARRMAMWEALEVPVAPNYVKDVLARLSLA